MAGWISFVLIAIVSMIAMSESRVIPAEPNSVIPGTHGNPIMSSKEKRTAMHPYPHRAMMFTGYYRPIRRSNNSGQATGVFAQGNAVSGETFFGNVHAPHLKSGPEPIEEPEISSAEAQAAPEEEQEQKLPPQRHQVQDNEEEEEHHHDEHHYHHKDSLIPQEHHEPEQIPLTTELARTEEPIAASSTEVSVAQPKAHRNKKTHKTPVIVDTSEEDDEDEVDDEDDEPVVPFIPFKGNKRRQGYPNLNNFFPMVFSFPRLATRAGSSGSFPGAITAIANSYSTAKGGVASSRATAYGGSPGKKQRPQQYEE